MFGKYIIDFDIKISSDKKIQNTDNLSLISSLFIHYLSIFTDFYTHTQFRKDKIELILNKTTKRSNLYLECNFRKTGKEKRNSHKNEFH